MATDSNRELIFGLLGLQNGLIDSGMLVAAFHAWTLDRTRTLAEHLVSRGSIDEEQRRVLDLMVDLHLKKHGNDAERSLCSFSIEPVLRQALETVGDPSIDHSLALANGVAGQATLTYLSSEKEGGRFRLLRPHAQGGLGAVSIALDQELNREVAVKEILSRFSVDEASRQRFLLEAEITGGLEHPGVVPVYGLGKYSDGRPYYAMRFIRGDSLKQAIDAFHRNDASKDGSFHSVDFRKLLGRFNDVCYAMEYAHSRGVIHRDLKPSNIMLGKYGETLVVDWGLAKALGRADQLSDSPESALVPSSGSSIDMTEMGAVIGTPSYMSPEQAAGKLDDLGPSSDVYSLGATLYHLLVGQAPFTKRPVHEIIENVRTGNIPLPSTLNPRIPKVLEAVCLKAMSRLPGERYPSAGAIAEEIEKWLADEPVSCVRESSFDRMRRWMKRNQSFVASSIAASMVLLLCSLVITVIVSKHNRSLNEKNSQLDVANLRLADANSNLEKSIKAERIAKIESEKKRQEAELAEKETEQVLDYLVAAFRKPDPANDGEKVTVAELLIQAEQQLQEKFSSSPRVQMKLLSAIGETYIGLGLFPRAANVFQRAIELKRAEFGEDHDFTLQSRARLGYALFYADQVDSAVSENERTWNAMKKKYGEDDLRTVSVSRCLASLYAVLGKNDLAIDIFKKALRVTEEKLGPDHKDTIDIKYLLALNFHDVGKNDEAIPLYRDVFRAKLTELGPDHPETLHFMDQLAGGFHMAGQLDEAIKIYEMMVELMKSKLGDDHPHTLNGIANLAFAYRMNERYEDEFRIIEAAMDSMIAKLGPKNMTTLAAMNTLALHYSDKGRYDEAISLLTKVVESSKEIRGIDHRETLAQMGNLSSAYYQAGQVEEALAVAKETYERFEKVLGKSHRLSLNSANRYGMMLTELNKLPEGIQILEETLRICETELGNDHYLSYVCRTNLGSAYRRAGRLADAIERYRKAAENLPTAQGDWPLDRKRALELLIETLIQNGEEEQAKPYQDKLDKMDKAN